jgi:hypothetical protein
MVLRVALLLALLLRPSTVGAADDRSVSAGGTVSALNMQSNTDVAFSGALTYAFNRVVGLEVEATLAPTLRTQFDGPTILGNSGSVGTLTAGSLAATSAFLIYPGPLFANQRGRLVVFSNNVRLAIPTTSSHVTPYFVAGGGIGQMRRSADLTYASPIVVPTPGLPLIPIPTPRPITQRVVSSEIDLALTIGGGVDVRVAERFAVGADLRMFRLLGGSDDQNVGRFGASVRYLF